MIFQVRYAIAERRDSWRMRMALHGIVISATRTQDPFAKYNSVTHACQAHRGKTKPFPSCSWKQQ